MASAADLKTTKQALIWKRPASPTPKKFKAISSAGVRGLHNLEINVPNAVLLGETVTLECSWQLEDEEALYSVKWYRGREEFYRYIPKELPHTRVFPLPGIEVDISRSGARRVVLQQATPAMAGRFRCEVSADAPTFHTEIRSAPLEVVGKISNKNRRIHIKKI
ncbi:uncharacterized protein LOC101745057 [Bombyx mori]|uniref:uncharacterized protein LOC101745057 n=1 Tax=Bombyx mori TaxID=7091 RepID=UPI002ED35342